MLGHCDTGTVVIYCLDVCQSGNKLQLQLSQENWSTFRLHCCSSCRFQRRCLCASALPNVIIKSFGKIFNFVKMPMHFSDWNKWGGKHISTLFSIKLPYKQEVRRKIIVFKLDPGLNILSQSNTFHFWSPFICYNFCEQTFSELSVKHVIIWSSMHCFI